MSPKNPDDAGTVLDEGAITAVQKSMTNYDVFVHLSKKIDDSETKADLRHSTMQTTFFERLGTLESHQKADRKEIVRMRDGRFPQRPLWAIAAAIVFCAITFAGIASCNDLHPPMAPAVRFPYASSGF